nr:hypothetical protein GCM10020063_057820 [Dactylosporangium thailandense]
MATRTSTVQGWTGNLRPAVGAAARGHLGAAADVMAWAGWCLGTAAACCWLRRQLGGEQRS